MRLRHGLKQRGFVNDPLIMLSNGGVIGIDVAKRFPVRMVESGPAAGALAASYYAEVLGLDRLLSFDMGGTTAKACIIEDRQPLVVGNFEVDRHLPLQGGQRTADPHSLGRHDRDRRRRRQHRLDERSRSAQGRPAKRGLGAWPGLLWPRRHKADRHRRRPRARLSERRQFPRRRHEARSAPRREKQLVATRPRRSAHRRPKPPRASIAWSANP